VTTREPGAAPPAGAVAQQEGLPVADAAHASEVVVVVLVELRVLEVVHEREPEGAGGHLGVWSGPHR
jgi:hypothetical protein